MFVTGSYFVSPADATYNALGLMKWVNVQSAAALADAREVLASGSRSGSRFDDINCDKENKENIESKNETGTSKSQTKIMVRGSLTASFSIWLVELFCHVACFRIACFRGCCRLLMRWLHVAAYGIVWKCLFTH